MVLTWAVVVAPTRAKGAAKRLTRSPFGFGAADTALAMDVEAGGSWLHAVSHVPHAQGKGRKACGRSGVDTKRSFSAATGRTLPNRSLC
jgi:hypothetical protein